MSSIDRVTHHPAYYCPEAKRAQYASETPDLSYRGPCEAAPRLTHATFNMLLGIGQASATERRVRPGTPNAVSARRPDCAMMAYVPLCARGTSYNHFTS